jgi:hypothetical protein
MRHLVTSTDYLANGESKGNSASEGQTKAEVEYKSSVIEQWDGLVDLGAAVKLTKNASGTSSEASRGHRPPRGKFLFLRVQYLSNKKQGS